MCFVELLLNVVDFPVPDFDDFPEPFDFLRGFLGLIGFQDLELVVESAIESFNLADVFGGFVVCLMVFGAFRQELFLEVLDLILVLFNQLLVLGVSLLGVLVRPAQVVLGRIQFVFQVLIIFGH